MPKKTLEGIVISDKGNKSITVMVERKYQHPVLQKVLKSKKNIMFMMKITPSKLVIMLKLLSRDQYQKLKDLKF